MTLFTIIRDEAGSELRVLVALASTSALSNALILASINAGAAAPEQVEMLDLGMLMLLISLFVMCARYVNQRVATLLETALHRIKVRVGNSIIRVELDRLEQIRAAEICDRITENTTFISERTPILASLMQAVLIVFFLAIYIGYTSLPGLALLVLLIAIVTGLFMTMRREFVFAVRHTAKLRLVFFDQLADLLDGFKQLKFSRRAGRELRDDLEASSESLRVAGVRSSELMADNMMLSTGLAFGLLASIVFILPRYVALEWSTLATLIAAAMFLRGPVFAISMGMLPYVRANVSLAQIAKLEHRLEHAARAGLVDKSGAGAERPWRTAPRSIVVRGLEYSYAATHGESGFHIGPLDLRFEAGEVVFIVGGNGSGKSTLLKTLIGLYPASAGSIAVDGLLVGDQTRAHYREQITAIFSDFHLFERLYGLGGVESEQVAELITRMQLDGVTGFSGEAFTKLSLSTGQRKRLAMVVALLEDRPICVFDEWPADQDPSFRRYFYEELLPSLRRAGKIVIAVSHDDRYFEHADRVLTMEYGQLRSVVSGQEAGS